MKKLLLLLSVCCIFSSCMTAEEKAAAEAAKLLELLETTDSPIVNEPEQINIDSVRRAQVKENNSNNVFFMGLKFGMSKTKYLAKVRELFVGNKLFQYSQNTYAANLTTLNEKSFYAELWDCQYENDKLVKLTLAMWLPESGITIGAISDLFNEKYGDYYTDDNSRIWIKGNLEVQARETYVSSDPNLPSIKTTLVSYVDNNYFIPTMESKQKDDANKLKSTLDNI